MNDLRDVFDRAAGRGEERGAHDTLAAARRSAWRHERRQRRLAVATVAGTVVLVAVAAVVLTDDGGGQQVTSAGPSTTSAAAPTTTSPSQDTGNPPSVAGEGVPPYFAFSYRHGGVVVVEGNAVNALGGIQGEEGSADLEPTPDGRSVYHPWIATGCLTNIARTDLDGTSETILNGATTPAVDPLSRYLAYATSDGGCLHDPGVVAVRDLKSGQEWRHDLNGYGDDLPFTIRDMVWTGDDLVVLASQSDGAAEATSWLVRYEFSTDVGLSFKDQQTPPSIMHGWRRVVPSPGNGSAVVVTQQLREGQVNHAEETQFVEVDMATGASRTLHTTEGDITSFAIAQDGLILFVRSNAQQAVVDQVHLWDGEDETMLHEGVNSVQWVP